MVYILAIVILIAVHMYAVYKREKKNLTKKGTMKMALGQSIYLFFVLFIMALGLILKKTGAADALRGKTNGYILYFGMIVVVMVIFAIVLHKKNQYERVIREVYSLDKEELDARAQAKAREKRMRELQKKKAEREAKAEAKAKAEKKHQAKLAKKAAKEAEEAAESAEAEADTPADNDVEEEE
ncbi:MAG: hypothetical protein PUB39_07580 [Eubacteriales bacterium]|nr:hypothetical protein [Eubacteriales bacterium]